jgi:hypothetical protein
MDEKQSKRFRQALQAKDEKVNFPEEPELHDPGRPPDTRDPRAKSTGHGKKTADKWNQ